MRFILPFTILIFLFSCSAEKEFEQELKVIDANQKTLDSLEQVVANLPYDSLTYMVKTCKENLGEAQKYYTMDTLDQKFAQELTYYKGIKKGVPKAHKLHHDWEDEVEVLKKQFEDLEADVKNGKHSKEKVKEYLQNEGESVKNLMKEIRIFEETYKSVSSVFYKYNDKVEKYIEHLKELHEAKNSSIQ